MDVSVIVDGSDTPLAELVANVNRPDLVKAGVASGPGETQVNTTASTQTALMVQAAIQSGVLDFIDSKEPPAVALFPHSFALPLVLLLAAASL